MLRSDVAVTTLENKIYAVGGYNGATGLKSAESYDPELNIWQKVKFSYRISIKNDLQAFPTFNKNAQ